MSRFRAAKQLRPCVETLLFHHSTGDISHQAWEDLVPVSPCSLFDFERFLDLGPSDHPMPLRLLCDQGCLRFLSNLRFLSLQLERQLKAGLRYLGHCRWFPLVALVDWSLERFSRILVQGLVVALKLEKAEVSSRSHGGWDVMWRSVSLSTS